MTKVLTFVNDFLWGAPALVMILGVGIYLTVELRAVQLRLFPQAFRQFLQMLRPGKTSGPGVSSFQALCTALAATVGTGNLVGVAGALCLGGPGAIFWMWVCGFLGMATKYAEVILAVRYRVRDSHGFRGGPMYVITGGLGERFRPLAVGYCLCGLAASFGIGNAAQVNGVVTGVQGMLSRFGGRIDGSGNLLLGLLLAAVIGSVLLGGGQRIGAAAEKLVPLGAGLYILMCAGVLLARAGQIPQAFRAILQGAWNPRAATGGMLGSVFLALRIGCSRGVFTNEAGMGTASIAHGSAAVSHPARQGLMGIMEVFLDTIVICTLTALVILVSGVPVSYGQDTGAELTVRAFASVYGTGASVAIALSLLLFAVATILGWGLYGGVCAEFLFGAAAGKWYSLAQTAMVILSAVMDTRTVWRLSEVLNGLMVIPNLITLAALTPELRRLTKEYIKSDGIAVSGGTYADFHQCKPL